MYFKGVKPKVIVICGPTALGKTSTAIHLAKHFHGEIIGADSMQVYKYMDIGTAKPTPDEQARVKHHMIDFIDPDEHFDAKKYATLSREKVMELHEQKIIPFVVGGTGLYIKALFHGLFNAKTSDSDIRDRLKAELQAYGSTYLYKRLCRQDSDTAKKIHPKDTYRIIRALEVYALTGKTLTEFHRSHGFEERPFIVLKIGLHINREILYDRINKRVQIMINSGFINEVRRLLAMGYSPELKSMQSIGYRHIVNFIEGHLTWDETIRTLKRDTRRYAKRQMTWFKADPEIIWKEPEALGDIKGLIKKFLQGK
ncbi:MAG: tRNA (adenosine(37)-N6)-dimethylallyltransferase MiaA [Deltaproteobacteria bacterium]|jgi:tRNA dimethylallyltransferase|nr:tRNA (adenosine(37)-N6)-dimethylallyltransferase MiaA [Deltaproteobacteria bacterium]